MESSVIIISPESHNFPLVVSQEATVNYPQSTSTYQQAKTQSTDLGITILGAVVRAQPLQLIADYYIGVNNRLMLVTYDTFLKEIKTERGLHVARQWKWSLPNGVPPKEFLEAFYKALGPIAITDNPMHSLEGIEIYVQPTTQRDTCST